MSSPHEKLHEHDEFWFDSSNALDGEVSRGTSPSIALVLVYGLDPKLPISTIGWDTIVLSLIFYFKSTAVIDSSIGFLRTKAPQNRSQKLLRRTDEGSIDFAAKWEDLDHLDLDLEHHSRM
eukprot:SAG11_NODE_3362_length_2499_cov_1.650417_3_plen_121_part_00